MVGTRGLFCNHLYWICMVLGCKIDSRCRWRGGGVKRQLGGFGKVGREVGLVTEVLPRRQTQARPEAPQGVALGFLTDVSREEFLETHQYDQSKPGSWLMPCSCAVVSAP